MQVAARLVFASALTCSCWCLRVGRRLRMRAALASLSGPRLAAQAQPTAAQAQSYRLTMLSLLFGSLCRSRFQPCSWLGCQRQSVFGLSQAHGNRNVPTSRFATYGALRRLTTSTSTIVRIQWPFGRADYAHSHYASNMADIQITHLVLHRICHDKVTRSGSRHQPTTKHNLQYRTVRVRLSTWQSAARAR